MRYGLDQIIERVGRNAPGQATALDHSRRRSVARAIVRPLLDFPKQAMMCRALGDPRRQLVALSGNRRTGKTTAPGRWTLAQCIARNGFVVRILTQVLIAPTHNWLDAQNSNPEGSALKLLERGGLLDHVTVRRKQGGIVSEIVFPWHSLIAVHDIASLSAADNKRGFSADLYWVDEAQNVAMLAEVMRQLVAPTLPDTGAHVLFGGTPGIETGSLFYRASKGDDPEYFPIRLFSWENPYYGPDDATRWARIVSQWIRPLRMSYDLTVDDVDRLAALSKSEREDIAEGCEPAELADWVKNLSPDLLRECFGRWVEGGAEYVYPAFHGKHSDAIYWAAASENWRRFWPRERLPALTLPVHNTIADRVAALPAYATQDPGRRLRWRTIIIYDLGNNPSYPAFVVLAYAHGHGRAYVLHSERAPLDVGDDYCLERFHDLIDELGAAGVRPYKAVVDMGGVRMGSKRDLDRATKERFGDIEVKLPRKHNAEVSRRSLNLAIQEGRIALLAGDVIDLEGRYLRYRPQDPIDPKPREIWKFRAVELPDGTKDRPGDHGLDCLRYGVAELPELAEAEPPPKPRAIPFPTVSERLRSRRQR